METLRRIGKFLVSLTGQALILGFFIALIAARYIREHGTDLSPHTLYATLVAATRRGFPPGMLISIALFSILSLYWEAAAKNSSQTKSSESSRSRSFHVTLVTLSQILVMFPIPGLRARFLPRSTILVIAALLAELAFFALTVWARQTLGRHWSGAVTAKVDHELIRTGPYSVVRHPIYTGFLGVYFSMAFVSGEIHGLLGTALAVLAYWRKIRLEEKNLGGIFGSDFDGYRSHTWALIPGIW
jgi:protein-S-isoprenylcysteine O-methyltransferase Ste14